MSSAVRPLFAWCLTGRGTRPTPLGAALLQADTEPVQSLPPGPGERGHGYSLQKDGAAGGGGLSGAPPAHRARMHR